MTTMPLYLRDTIAAVDLSEVRATRARDDVSGFGQVEYRTIELAQQDHGEGWAYAIDALDAACEDELQVPRCRNWKLVGRDGRWVRFQAF